MSADNLLKTLPILQQQIDALIEFQPNSTELTNGVINSWNGLKNLKLEDLI